MIGIRAISTYIPDEFIDNVAQGRSFGEHQDFIMNKIGSVRLPLKHHSQDTSDLAVKAVDLLRTQHNLSLEQIELIVVVTQNPDGSGLPHTSAVVQSKLEISNSIAAFDISLGCSGYVYGLSVAKGLMQEAGYKNAVLITCDPYSKIIDRHDRVTSLLFGDAATATWLGESPEWIIGSPMLDTDGSGWKSLYVAQNGKLQMNGREIFNFAAVQVPLHINRYLNERRIDPKEVDLFCLHQGSAAIIDAISRRYPDLRERFLKDTTFTGNTVSSSIPILLDKHVMKSDFKRVLLVGFGVGLSWATNLIERKI